MEYYNPNDIGFGQYDPEYQRQEKERLERMRPMLEREEKIRKLWPITVKYWQKMNLSFRVANALAINGISNIKQLYQYDSKSLLKLSGIGKVAINEINRNL